MAKRWSPEENLILTRIWRSPALLKTQMHLLPGRTYGNANQHATKKLKLGLKCSPGSQVFRQADVLMGDNRPRTAREIAVLISRSAQHVRRVMQAAVKRREYRIVQWNQAPTGGEWQAIYRRGRGKSKPRPTPLTSAERGRKYRKRVAAQGVKTELSRVGKVSLVPPRDELMDALYGRRDYVQASA